MSDNVDELRELLADQASRVKFVDLVSFGILLSNCIIDRNYRLSDKWVEPMRFTALGEQTIDACINHYSRLKPNDAKMAVFLAVGCTDGVFVDISTDIDRLRLQLSSEVCQGRIKYPYIFGRELHDMAAELFPAQTRLDNNQTVRLLGNLPIGVFQAGRTVVGPYGCTYSDVPRQAYPDNEVPGYLCQDASCTAVHSITLSTGDSSIAKARSRVDQYISRTYSKMADPHIPLIRRAATLDFRAAAPLFSTLNIIDVLSDGLGEEELRLIIDNLLRRTFKREGRKTDISKRLGAVITNPSDFAAVLGRPELMQIALLHSDSDLIAAIDETVSEGKIQFKDSEVRVCKVSRWGQQNQRPRAQIGPLGVRFTNSPSTRLITSRMLHLLHTLYFESEFLDEGDLAYAIEAPNNLSAGDLLNRAIRDRSVEDLFRTLILPNRRAVEVAANEVSLFDYENLSREQVLERLRWKIGEFPIGGFTDLQRIDEYLGLVQAANDEERGADTVRAASSNLFAAVEDALNRALIFSIWALTTDHHISEEKFTYNPEPDRSIIEFIELNAPTSESKIKLKRGKNTLVPLGAGFPRLAKALRNLDAAAHKRPEKDIPVECIVTSRPFAFPYTRMFFNLTPAAQSDILTALQAVGRHAQNEDVVEVRNWEAHGDTSFPGAQSMTRALEHVRELRYRLENSGLYPRVYELVNLSRDDIGREELLYANGEDRISLFRPSWAVAPGLPMGQARVVIFPVARTASSGPLRFVLKARPGTDPYWDGWPKRWPARREYSKPQQMAANSDDFADAG